MLDAYQPCPCGSGKKVKFCCSKDITSELNKIITAIQSDQRVSAMEQVNRTISAKGERDCLLVLKIALLLHLRRIDDARELIDRMLEANPDNPLVLADAAGIALQDNDVDQAVVLLQNALNSATDTIPATLVRTFKMVGMALLMTGRFNAGRVHLALYMSWLEEPDEEVVRLLMQAYSAQQVPMLLREDLEIRQPPEDVEWIGEWDEIAQLVGRMRFRAAIERLREAEARFPKDPCLRRNIAVLESRLGDDPATADAWRAFASIEGVELHEAIEAEAIAQLLDQDQDRDFLELKRITFTTPSAGDAVEKMLADKCFDLARSGYRDKPEEGPPPKAVFLWLDKPVPSSEAELTIRNIPEIVADVFVYGRETDRPARIVIELVADEKLDAYLTTLKETLGDALGEPDGDAEVLDRFTRQSSLLGWRWRMPSEVSPEQQEQLAVEKHRQVLHEVWPDLPLDVLDGKTPREAAQDPSLTIPLHAAILLLEQSGDEQLLDQLNINELRQSLGLELREVIDPATVDMRSLSLSRFCRVDFLKLDDQQLIDAMERAIGQGLVVPAAITMEEVIRRESIDENRYDPIALRVQLARMIPDSARAIELMGEAQEIIVKQGKSPAGLLVHEIDLRLSRGIAEGFEQLMQRLDRNHIREPGVSNAIAAVLQKYGLLEPAPRGPTGQPAVPAVSPAAGSAPIQSDIWTPGSEPAPAARSSIPSPPADEGPSKLWLPGMD